MILGQLEWAQGHELPLQLSLVPCLPSTTATSQTLMLYVTRASFPPPPFSEALDAAEASLERQRLKCCPTCMVTRQLSGHLASARPGFHTENPGHAHIDRDHLTWTDTPVSTSLLRSAFPKSRWSMYTLSTCSVQPYLAVLNHCT